MLGFTAADELAADEPLLLSGTFSAGGLFHATYLPHQSEPRIRITALTVRALGKDAYSVEDRHAEREMNGTGSSGFTTQKNAFFERTVSGGGRDVTVRHDILPDSSGVKFTVSPSPDQRASP